MAEKNPNKNLIENLLPINLNSDIDFDSTRFKSILWTLSFISATSAYLTFKSTAFYNNLDIHKYDRTPVVLVTIACVLSFLASVSFTSKAGYLFDLRRRPNAHWFASATSWVMEVGMIGFLFHEKKLMEDAPTMVFATTLAVFFLCFPRAVAPGFGRRLPIIAMYAATTISINVGRFWALMPYTAAIVYAQITLADWDKRHIILDP